MRLQVKYPDSQPHEVELLGRVSIVGRDPTCDLVVHDVKCSRRHAVLETGPDGITVRDSGSANGVFVNGQRVERAVLRAGDTVSLGEVQLQILPEVTSPSAEATLMTPTASFPTAPSPVPPPAAAAAAHLPRPVPPPPPPPPPAAAVLPPPPLPITQPAQLPRGSYSLSGSTESGKVRAEQLARDVAAEAAQRTERPLTVTVLAVLWMASVVLYLATGIGGLVGTGGIAGILSAVFGGLMAALSGAMALGLWKVMPWARIAQIVIAALGVLTCSFTLPSVATLVYMLRPGVRARFATGRGPGDSREGLFTALILGTVALGVLLASGLWALAALGLGGSRLE